MDKDVQKINKKKHNVEQTLLDLLEATAEELLRRVKSGEAGPQDISNAIRMMKENDIDIHINQGDPDDILSQLEDLPFESDKVVNMNNKRK